MTYDHELRTAISLAQMNYDVVFAPAMMFRREDKKFDVYLLRDTVLLKADLKCVSGMHYLTLGNRIKEGTEQASRVVVDIVSNMDAKTLVQGLRLPKSLITNDRIFDILKNEKGYT